MPQRSYGGRTYPNQAAVEWARRQERARANRKAISFANAVRVGTQLDPKLRSDLERAVAAPVRIQKAVAPSLASLAARVLLLARKKVYLRAVAMLKKVNTSSVIAGAVLGEAISQAVEGEQEIPRLAGEAGEAVADLIRGSGESFGIGGSDEAVLSYLTPRKVAMYIGRRLLTVVREEAAQMVLDGMKRGMRDRIRVM